MEKSTNMHRMLHNVVAESDFTQFSYLIHICVDTICSPWSQNAFCGQNEALGTDCIGKSLILKL